MSAKTHKGLRKRLKRTAGGKLLHRASGKRHSMSKKPAYRARRLGEWREFRKGQRKSLERQYGRI